MMPNRKRVIQLNFRDHDTSNAPLVITADMLGIPEELYTPLFAIARISGWCAHRIEEVVSGKRIMRPAYRAAVLREPYIEMADR